MDILSIAAARAENENIAGFYDAFSSRLVDCYIKGNPRVDAAVGFVADYLPQEATRLLEIGCGIGETTHRLQKRHRHLRATGIDISHANIAAAKALFGDNPNLHYSLNDMSQPVAGGPFDVVTLLDVYEHIPRHARGGFHKNLRASMCDHTRLIVTCPSYLHQNHLHQHNPAGLQIVDETIGPAELVQLASDLGGQLTHFQYGSVWRTNDYLYATIDRQVQYITKPSPTGLQKLFDKYQRKWDRSRIGGRAARARLVESKLRRAA